MNANTAIVYCDVQKAVNRIAYKSSDLVYRKSLTSHVREHARSLSNRAGKIQQDFNHNRIDLSTCLAKLAKIEKVFDQKA